MTKAKMPVAKHYASRRHLARAGQVWTEKLIFGKDSVAPLIRSGMDLCPPHACTPLAGTL